MKALRLILIFILTLNFANAREGQREIAFPYSFKTQSYVQDTDSRFLAYGNEFRDMPLLAEKVEAIFKASPEALAELIANTEEIAQAQEFLAKAGDFSDIDFEYGIFDGDKIIALLKSKKGGASHFMLINEVGKWEVAKLSPLYAYLAENAGVAEIQESPLKQSDNIELYTADEEFLDTSKNEEVFEDNDIYFYYTELYAAFFNKDFDTFRAFLDDDSNYAFGDKIGDAQSSEEIALALGDELKEKRIYKNIAKLSDIYVIFYDSYKNGEPEPTLEFALVRDISCGIEIMYYGVEREAVLADFISTRD